MRAIGSVFSLILVAGSVTAVPSRPLKASCFSWIPAFAGMTAGENVPFSVIPAKAGIQGTGCSALSQNAAKDVSEVRSNDSLPAFFPDVFSHRSDARPQIELNGEWELRRDPDGIGRERGWHEGKEDFPDKMTVPGAPQAQGIGEPHQYQRTSFKDPFWIRRRFILPQIDEAERVWLRLGGVLPAADIYLNGAHVGYTKSSRTQQRIDVTDLLRPGEENLIVIKVCDFPEVRLDGLLEWNEGTQLWTGPYRRIACEITGSVSVLDATFQSDVGEGTVHVNAVLTEPAATRLELLLDVLDGDTTVGSARTELPAGAKTASASIHLSSFETWSPGHPKLYTLGISVQEDAGKRVLDRCALRFGLREISVEGTRFYLNGKPIFLRVYGEDHYYPDTLCPPDDKQWYLARLKRAREYGFNAVKGCVETIPQDYLEAADEAGIMVIQEMPFGLSTLRANRYTIDGRFREYYSQELDGLIRVSRNHPSVIAYSMSSELEFSNQTQESFDFFSRDLVRQTRGLAPHALAIDCTGYLNGEETEKGRRDTDFYASVHPKWMKEVLDESDMITDGMHPTILHEYNWWSSYPDPKDRQKYDGAQLFPFWLDTLERTAWENGQGELVSLYHKNSQWLQTLCRKDGIEYARRNPQVEGFILWLLVDFGHWCEGLLDDFWNPKNVTPEEFLRSNGDTVILLAQEGERCYPMGGKVRIPLVVSHYGEDDYPGSTLEWKVAGGPIEQAGSFSIPELPQGELTAAGTAEIDLHAAKQGYKFEVKVALSHKGRVINTNEWSFWAFPESSTPFDPTLLDQNAGETMGSGIFLRLFGHGKDAIPQDATTVISDCVDEALSSYVGDGGRCLLFSQGSNIDVRSVCTCSTADYGIYRTIPWNKGDSGNSGTVISSHPALEAFPHEGMCDLPFLHMLKGYYPMQFDALREYGVTPIVRNIDHYYSNRNLAYVLEFKVGKGRVLVTSLGILDTLASEIESRYLLGCLVDYVSGEKFEPAATLPEEVFLRLFSQREGPK